MAKSRLARILRVTLGQIVSGVGIVFMLRANVGTDPWNVLHQGLHRATGISVGLASILAALLAIGVAMLLGERIGLATLTGAVIPGLVIDCVLNYNWVPLQTDFWGGMLLLVAGLEILTIGTWMYLKECLGAGPRDSLNVALARKTRFSVGACRSAIELLALAAGWLLGGQVGAGTIVSAVGIGVLFQINFRLLRFDATALRQESLLDLVRRGNRE